MRLLISLFIAVPLLEIYVLVKVGGLLGPFWTITAVISTAIVGAILVRLQGAATIGRLRIALAQGELPARTIIEGFLLLVAGVLLLTPGFFTDFIGFFCLIPSTRMLLVSWALKVLLPKMAVVSPSSSTAKNSVDGEFRRID